MRARRARARRQACATVSAGNTGAAMAAALLRMGRIKAWRGRASRRRIPRPGSTPVLLCDAGANAECTAEMLVQFAQMAGAHASQPVRGRRPRVGLLSIGEEPTKGTPLVKEVHAAAGRGVERRRVLRQRRGPRPHRLARRRDRDRRLHGERRAEDARGRAQVHVLDADVGRSRTDEATQGGGDVLLGHLLPMAEDLDPDTHGGAILLGVDGVCVISHGSSSARAIKNALRVAHDLANAAGS